VSTLGDRLHRRIIYSRRIRQLVRHLSALVPHGASVVDVGSGDGMLAATLLKARPDITIRGFDVLVRGETFVPVEPFDGAHIPLADGAVDIALIVDVLHHTDDPGVVLAEAARVARHGVVVKDHLREGFLAGPTLRFMDWVGNARHGVRLPYNYLSMAEWQALFAANRLVPEGWTEDLALYAAPADWLFGRRLHFTTRLVRRG